MSGTPMSTQAGVPSGQGVSRVGIAPPSGCEAGHGATGVRQFPDLRYPAQNRPPPVPPPPKSPPAAPVAGPAPAAEAAGPSPVSATAPARDVVLCPVQRRLRERRG